MLTLAATTTTGGIVPHEVPGLPDAGSLLWVGLVLLPVLLAVIGRIWASVARVSAEGGARFHGRWAVGATGTALALLLGLWFGGAAQGPIQIGGFASFGLQFSITPASLLFSLFACWLWFMAALFAQGYLAHSHAHARFYLYFLLCLTGTLGTFQAGNLLTLFVFFEMVSLGAYPLVVHEETDEAHSAGRLYLYMSIAGGLCVFLGTAMLYGLRGTTELSLITDAVAGDSRWLLTAGLLLVGFAVKAGLVPLHIWLPRAHPVAPAPASALLSGVMIKTGAWGIYQVIRIFGSAAGEHAAAGEASSALVLSTAAHAAAAAVLPAAESSASLATSIGGFLVPIALLTMFLGASMALFATNGKRVLAYSSVSQIGYVILGAALAGVLGTGEAMGSAGFAFHALAHALFKATMFMLIGLIYQKTHDLDIRRLGPLGRRMPVTAVVFGLCVLGIIGMPGFSGYPSKTLLHDAILLLRHDIGGSGWAAVEWTFILTSAMTTAYMGKLWYLLFVRRPLGVPGTTPAAHGEHGDDHGHPVVIGETASEKAIVILAALPLVAVGIGYHQVLEQLVLPFTAAMGLGHEAAHHVEHLAFFGQAALSGAVLPLSLGALLLLVLAKLRFPGPLPDHLPSIEGTVVTPLVRGLYRVMQFGAWFDRRVDGVIVGAARVAMRFAQASAAIDGVIDAGTIGTTRVAMRLVQASTMIDDAIDAGTVGTAKVGLTVVKLSTALDKAIDDGTAGTARLGMSVVKLSTALDKAIDDGTVGTVEAGAKVIRVAEKADGSMDRGFAAVAAKAWSAIVGTTTGQHLRPRPKQGDNSLSNLNVATLVLFAMAALVILLMLFWSGARVDG